MSDNYPALRMVGAPCTKPCAHRHCAVRREARTALAEIDRLHGKIRALHEELAYEKGTANRAVNMLRDGWSVIKFTGGRWYWVRGQERLSMLTHEANWHARRVAEQLEASD